MPSTDTSLFNALPSVSSIQESESNHEFYEVMLSSQGGIAKGLITFDRIRVAICLAIQTLDGHFGPCGDVRAEISGDALVISHPIHGISQSRA